MRREAGIVFDAQILLSHLTHLYCCQSLQKGYDIRNLTSKIGNVMQTLTKKVWKLKPPYGLFDETLVRNLFPHCSDGAKKALVHRAIQEEEVLRLKPGLFCLAESYREGAPHPYVLAGLLHSPSFVSLETALAYHGLIPEAVYQVSSITASRSRTFETPFGRFSYRRVPCSFFKSGVKARKVADHGWAFIAQPLRAIADIVYLRKSVSWKMDGLSFLTESLRIEVEDLAKIPSSEFEAVYTGIRSKRTREYIAGMRRELD